MTTHFSITFCAPDAGRGGLEASRSSKGAAGPPRGGCAAAPAGCAAVPVLGGTGRPARGPVFVAVLRVLLTPTLSVAHEPELKEETMRFRIPKQDKPVKEHLYVELERGL